MDSGDETLKLRLTCGQAPNIFCGVPEREIRACLSSSILSIVTSSTSPGTLQTRPTRLRHSCRSSSVDLCLLPPRRPPLPLRLLLPSAYFLSASVFVDALLILKPTDQTCLYVPLPLLYSVSKSLTTHTSQFDVSIGSNPAGRIVFKLYDETVPLTARNFRELAVGTEKDGKKLGYKGSSFHRIIPEVCFRMSPFQHGAEECLGACSS